MSTSNANAGFTREQWRKMRGLPVHEKIVAVAKTPRRTEAVIREDLRQQLEAAHARWLDFIKDEKTSPTPENDS